MEAETATETAPEVAREPAPVEEAEREQRSDEKEVETATETVGEEAGAGEGDTQLAAVEEREIAHSEDQRGTAEQRGTEEKSIAVEAGDTGESGPQNGSTEEEGDREGGEQVREEGGKKREKDGEGEGREIDEEVVVEELESAPPQPLEPAVADEEPQQTESGTPRESRRKERERKKRKKTKTPRDEGVRSSPRSRKKGSKSRGGHRRQMEEIIIALFLPFDPDNSGSVDSDKFWEIMQSPELNLQLEPAEVAALQEVVTPDRSGMVPYSEFAAQASDIIASLYHDKTPSEEYRVRMATPSGHRVLAYNKQTGEFQDLVEEGVDPFEENIEGLYQSADTEGRGYITRDEFIALFKLEQLALLTEEDHSRMTQCYDQVAPDGRAKYTEFYGLGKELILCLYRNQDTSDSEWLELQSEKLGRYQLNKLTGEVHRDPAAIQTSHVVEPQIDLINQAYRQAHEAVYEVEQYKEENRSLQNQLRQLVEEQETLTMQLEQTGHVLDEANAEIREKEEEVKRGMAVLAGKEHEIEDLRTQLAEAERVKEKLNTLERELESAQEEVEAKGQTMEARDSSVATLKTQSHRIVDKLKTAWAETEARDSTILKLKHQLQTEQTRMKTYQDHTPMLETKVGELEAEVKILTQFLEEKNSAFNTSRKHLKNARERNMELEKVAERAVQMEDKLKGAESEIRTLKGLLTSKTVMVERRKKELAETKARLGELEERDRRRSIILADILERTAREYQQTIQMGGARGAEHGMNFDSSLSSSQNLDSAGKRPVSAPALPPDQFPHLHTLTPGTSPRHTSTSSPRIIRTYTIPGRAGRRGPVKPSNSGEHRSRTVPKLPPIRRRDLSKSLPLPYSSSSSFSAGFHVPTVNETVQLQRQRDRKLVQHSESNPCCVCQLCTAGGATAESMEEGVPLVEQVALAGLAGNHEKKLSRQLSTGQRVLVSMKRSEFDLEPQQYTGIVKYVGKIDREYIDNRVYVGVKLDEPVGDTDGLVKGKRYFHCPAKHGKVLQLSNVIAILPCSGVSYKPLQSSKKGSYTSSVPSSHKRASVT